MSSIKQLLYLGNDKDFFEKLRLFASINIRTQYEISSKKYTPGSLIDSIITSRANIVYFDFTSIESKHNIIDEVLYIKKIDKLKSILFVALISDASNKREQQLLFSSGFQLGYVKGTEVESFLADSFYIGLEEKVPMPTYAKARKMDINLEVGVCSTLSSISLENFVVETDLETKTERINLELHLFKELQASSFKVKTHKIAPYVYPMTDTYTLEYPFVGPWDDITDETIQKETVETWIDLNDEALLRKDNFLKIISNNSAIYKSLYDSTSSMPLFVEVTDKIQFGSLKHDLTLKKPPIIFLDLEEEGANGMDSVAELINELKQIEQYKPILVLLNCPSKADALKKVYGYENIVCVPTPLTIDIFRLLTQSFLEKGKSSDKLDTLFFKFSNPIRAIDVSHDIIVTSLSEHEITFISKTDLPIFSVLHLTLPVECFVTLVPPYHELENSIIGSHYMGLIHGLSEDEKQRLRKFVNQVIYKPINEFSKEEVENILAQKIIKKESMLNEEDKDNVHETEVKTDTFKRTAIKGKSKL